jgi:hypothetical protein
MAKGDRSAYPASFIVGSAVAQHFGHGGDQAGIDIAAVTVVIYSCDTAH